MDEAGVRREIYTLLKELGYWPTRGRDATICPRCKASILPPIGRPDLLVLCPGRQTKVVEAKAINMAKMQRLPFSEITEEQRRWLTAWMEAGGLGYIAIGTVNERDRRLWIVDWSAWLEAENKIEQYQESIVVDSSKRGTRKEIRKQELGIVTLFSAYQLRRKTGGWELPAGHTIVL